MFKEYGEVISIDELGEMLSIGRNLAYRLLISGSLKAFRIGRKWIIPREAVEQYVRLQSGL